MDYVDVTSTISSATSSTNYNGTFTPDKTYDGNTSTPWVSQTVGLTFDEWIKYLLSSGKTLRKIDLYIVGTPSYTRIKNFTIQGSNNDSSWTTVYTGVGPDIPDQWVSFEFSNSTAYTYYKIEITSQYVTAQQTGFYEIKMYTGTQTVIGPFPTHFNS
jgi:hypothetical protein